MISVSPKCMKLMNELKKNNLETYFHCLRVKKLVNKFVLITNRERITGYTKKQIDYICKGALFHDIGKLNVKNYTLTKENRLNEEEMQEIRMHPQWGFELMCDELSDDEYDIVTNAILYHHERIDGKGYNQKTDLPFYVQILGACDAYEALTMDRDYHAAVSSQTALRMLEKGDCGAFDDIVIKYLRMAVNEEDEI